MLKSFLLDNSAARLRCNDKGAPFAVRARLLLNRLILFKFSDLSREARDFSEFALGLHARARVLFTQLLCLTFSQRADQLLMKVVEARGNLR